LGVVLDAPEQTLDALVRAAKERFAGVRDTSIAERMERLAPTERDNKLQTAHRNAHVLIQVDSERRQRYGHISAPELTQSLLIGTAPPDGEPALAAGGMLRRAIENQVAILPENFAQTLPDRFRLLLSYEMGVFSLHCVRGFADYRSIYRSPQAQARHRHTHTGVTFPDLFPPEEAEVRKRAERATVLSRALGLFVEETDPEIHDRAIYHYYVDRHGKHPVQLGRDWQAVEEHLFTSQKEKEILANVDQQATTALERVEEELRQKGKQATTRQHKEELWTRLQNALDDREAELEGGLRHAQHQVESSAINAYRDAYDLTPPTDWSPDERGASAAVSRSMPSSLPASDEPAGGIERFRQQVRQRLTNEELSQELEAALLDEAGECGLEFEQAERVLQEIERELRPVSLTENMQKYLDEYQRLWEQCQGQMTDRHQRYLQGKKRGLELTSDQAQTVEELVTGEGHPQ
jgi:hypothetical protein